MFLCTNLELTSEHEGDGAKSWVIRARSETLRLPAPRSGSGGAERSAVHISGAAILSLRVSALSGAE